MKKTAPFQISREKHLDHMVKVVPFLVFLFVVQSYFIKQINSELANNAIEFLAGCLIFMIGSFITYDVKHQVHFQEDHLEIKFLGLKKKINYLDIEQVNISSSEMTFSSVQLKTRSARHTFFFVDDAEQIKEFIESQKSEETQIAA